MRNSRLRLFEVSNDARGISRCSVCLEECDNFLWVYGIVNGRYIVIPQLQPKI